MFAGKLGRYGTKVKPITVEARFSISRHVGTPAGAAIVSHCSALPDPFGEGGPVGRMRRILSAITGIDPTPWCRQTSVNGFLNSTVTPRALRHTPDEETATLHGAAQVHALLERHPGL